MNNFFKYCALTFLILISAGILEARPKVVVTKQHKVRAKVVVAKPMRPTHIVARPASIRSGYIWIDGYWQWHGGVNKYVWINGKTVKKRKNKTWIAGRWSKTRGGFIYVKGRWA